MIVIALLCLFGCTQKNQINPNEAQMSDYQAIVNQIDQHKIYAQSSDHFSLRVVYREVDDHYRFDVILDQTRVKMYDLIFVVKCDSMSDDVCPNLGLFDEESYSLLPDYVNKEENFYKGVALSGMSKEKDAIKCFISYYPDESKQTRTQEWIELK